MFKGLLDSLKGWFDSEVTEKDIKLLAFISVVAFAILKLSRSPIDPNWVSAFYGLCALVGLGGPAWSLVQNMKKKEDPK